jgi:transcriptional regulator with XRE-family HTH domain
MLIEHGSDFDRHIGRRLRQLRLSSGKSQTELGQLIGLTFQQVQKYEKGTNRVSLENLWRLAQHFGVDLDYFLDGADQAPVSAVDRARDSARLRLEIARSLEQIDSATVLHGLLGVIRSFLPGVAE